MALGFGIDIVCIDDVCNKQSRAIEMCRGVCVCKRKITKASREATGFNV